VLVMAGVLFVRSRAEDTGVGLTISDLPPTSRRSLATRSFRVSACASSSSAALAVSSGQANVGFLDSQIAGYVVSQSKGAFKLVGSAVNVAPYGIATAKTSTGKGLAKAIEAALKTLVANGVYQSILTKWGVSAGALPVGKIVLNGAIS